MLNIWTRSLKCSHSFLWHGELEAVCCVTTLSNARSFYSPQPPTAKHAAQRNTSTCYYYIVIINLYTCWTFQSDSPLLPIPFIMTSAWANSKPKLSSLDTSLDASRSTSSWSVLRHVFIAAPPSSSSPPAWTICLGRLILCECMGRWWLWESEWLKEEVWCGEK